MENLPSEPPSAPVPFSFTSSPFFFCCHVREVARKEREGLVLKATIIISSSSLAMSERERESKRGSKAVILVAFRPPTLVGRRRHSPSPSSLSLGLLLSSSNHHKTNTDCEQWLQKPVIALGIFLLIVSLTGLIGACYRVTWLLWIYLLVMFVLILLVFTFTIFAFVVTNKGAGQALSNRGYKEYRLGDYSNWLQKRVNNTKTWNRIQSCL